MQKFHIQITVHPIENDKNGDGEINHEKLHYSLMTQGDGYDPEEVSDILVSIEDDLEEKDIEYANTRFTREPFVG